MHPAGGRHVDAGPVMMSTSLDLGQKRLEDLDVFPPGMSLKQNLDKPLVRLTGLDPTVFFQEQVQVWTDRVRPTRGSPFPSTKGQRGDVGKVDGSRRRTPDATNTRPV